MTRSGNVAEVHKVAGKDNYLASAASKKKPAPCLP